MEQRHNVQGYLFVLPFIFGFFVLFLYPLLQSFLYSFGDLDASADFKLVFTGINNYISALRSDAVYYRYITTAVRDMLYEMPVILIFSFIIANFLKNKFPGRGVIRLILFIPVILSSGVVATLESGDIMQGAMNSALSEETSSMISAEDLKGFMMNLNISSDFTGYIAAMITNILSIINHSGIQILIFLTALNSIPVSLYEASSIDGASAWENFWKITFPMTVPQMIVCLVYTIIDLFVSNNNKVIVYTYQTAFDKMQFGLSSAMSWIYTVIVTAVLGLFVFVFTRIFRYYQ